MSVASDYITGTISLTNGVVDFTGTSTGWLLAGFKEGDTIIDITGATEFMGVVATIDANGAGTLTKAWEGPTLVDVSYRMRYQPDGARVSAQARQLIELLGNGNLLAFSGLDGAAGDLVPMFNGAGTMVLVPKIDLTSGADYDVQVANLAARATYDGQTTGYAVLVSNVGDGRAAIYSKLSDVSADWSDPAYVTGPEGEPSTVPGITWQGAYNGATLYAINDGVTHNGSSFRKLTTAVAGNAPSGATPPVDNVNWEVLAAKGANGAGTIASIVPGPGIDVDATDPANPIISATATGLPPLMVMEQSESKALYVALGDSFGDGFKALGMVDTAGATNLDTSETGFLKPTTTADTYSTTVNPSLTSAAGAGSQNNNTSRMRIPASALTVDGDRVKVTLRASDSGPMGFDAVYIGHAGTGGSFDGTQVPVTFSGVSSGSVSAGGTLESDAITYAVDETVDLIVAIDFTTTNAAAQYNIGGATGYTWYSKDGASEASATTATGYTSTANAVLAVDLITVRTAVGTAAALTVASEQIPCAFIPSAIFGNLRVVPTGAVTLNTDLMIDVRRDITGDWEQAVLTLFFQDGGTSVLAFDDVSMAAEASGSDPQYRIRTTPGTMIEIDGVALGFRA